MTTAARPHHPLLRLTTLATVLMLPLVAVSAIPASAETAPSPTASVSPAAVVTSPTPAAVAEVPDPFAPGGVPAPSATTEVPPAEPSTPPAAAPATPPAENSSATLAPATPPASPAPSVASPSAPSPASPTATAPATPTTGAAAVTTSDAMADAITVRLRTDPQFRLDFIATIQRQLATDPVFAAKFRADVAQRYATDPFFRLVWAAGIRAGNDANINVGPKTWTGGTITHPRGATYYSAVTRWGELVLGIMAELNIDPYYFPGIMAQIQQESSGNPGATNGWDSNAQLGYASMGLLQIIAPTYQQYARPGYKGTLMKVTVPGTTVKQQFASPWQTYPYTNLYAALTYVIKRYGYSKFASWNGGANQGY